MNPAISSDSGSVLNCKIGCGIGLRVRDVSVPVSLSQHQADANILLTKCWRIAKARSKLS